MTDLVDPASYLERLEYAADTVTPRISRYLTRDRLPVSDDGERFQYRLE